MNLNSNDLTASKNFVVPLLHDPEKRAAADAISDDIQGARVRTINEIINSATEALLTKEPFFINLLHRIESEVNPILEKWRSIDSNSYSDKFNYRNKLQELKNRLTRVIAEKRNNLKSLSENRKKAEVRIRVFQHEHNISRDAKYPESKIFYVAITFLIIVLETLLNAEGHRGNGALIEGIYVAFGISATNVLLSLFLGKCFTYKNLKNKLFLNTGAWTSLVVFVVSAIFLNGFYASYRSEVLLTNAQPDLLKIISKTVDIFFLQYPFYDLKSHLTFLMTLVFSLVAFIEGYFLSDPYPGYESLDREEKNLKADEDEQRDLFISEIKKIVENMKNEYTLTIGELSNFSPESVTDKQQQIQQLKDDASNFEERVKLDMERFLGRFSEALSKFTASRNEPFNIKNKVKFERLSERVEFLSTSIIDQKKSILKVYPKVLKNLEHDLNQFTLESDLIIVSTIDSLEVNQELMLDQNLNQ